MHRLQWGCGRMNVSSEKQPVVSGFLIVVITQDWMTYWHLMVFPGVSLHLTL